MFIQVTKSEFINAFDRMNRSENFSYDARGALFDYLEETGQPMELDVIALCCEYTEASALDVITSYGLDYDTEEDDAFNVALDYLEEHTQVVWSDECDGVILYADF